MRNIDELITELCKAFHRVKEDNGYVAQASELARIAGKIIKAQKLQLDYAAARKEPPSIEFFNKPKI